MFGIVIMRRKKLNQLKAQYEKEIFLLNNEVYRLLATASKAGVIIKREDLA